MELKIFTCLLIVCLVCGGKVEEMKETFLQKHSISTTPKTLEAEEIAGVSTDGIHKLSSTPKMEVKESTNAYIDDIKKTPAKTTTAAVTYKSLKTTGKKTRTKTTTPQSTTETTTETTTTEEPTTTESTTMESTTEESTRVETTTETTTTETTTETTTKSTVTESASSKSNVRPTPRIKPGSTSPAVNSSSPTKSWQKYVTKSTPLPKQPSPMENTNTSSKEKFKEPTEHTSPIPYRKATMAEETSLTVFTYKTSQGSSSGKENSKYDNDGVNAKKTYTSSEPNSRAQTSTTSSNSSVDIKIDIDIKLKSSVTSTSAGDTNNISTEYYSSSQDPYPTVPSKNREKRHERKKVVAGVILVVLISLSAAFAVLFVIVPGNSEVENRRYHRRPDQVELIAPGRRYRPRYYDASLYMGH